MNLTPQQKEDVSRFSGWPIQSVGNQDNPSYNSYLNQWVLDIDYSETAISTVQKFIDRIKGIDAVLEEAVDRMSATSLGHNEIRLNEDEEYRLVTERKRIIRELRKFLRIPKYK